MRNLDAWLNEYQESHRHPVNKAIHKIAIPMITLSLIGMLWVAPILPLLMILAVLIFYWRLSKAVFLGMLLFFSLEVLVVWVADIYCPVPLWIPSLLMFIVAWLFQFVGHAIEGKRPSFTEDLAFLAIGPIWVLEPLLRKSRD